MENRGRHPGVPSNLFLELIARIWSLGIQRGVIAYEFSTLGQLGHPLRHKSHLFDASRLEVADAKNERRRYPTGILERFQSGI